MIGSLPITPDVAGPPSAIETATMRAVSARFLPLLVGAFLVTYLDRVNVGFAALTANRDLGLSTSQFAFGAGIFFLGYFIAELPSNLALERVGPRRWLARILVSIGLISGCMVAVQGARSFYLVRFLLGVAEAGLFPGVIFTMTTWFPRRTRARSMALFMLAIPLSSFIGSPISGALLGLDGVLGLRGWQWLYLLEALPSVVLGLLCLWLLTDDPAAAHWLAPAQRNWLAQEMAAERAATPAHVGRSRWRLALNPTLLAYAAVFFGVTAGTYGLSIWLPLMLSRPGLSHVDTGALVAIPFGFGCIATIYWGYRSDRLQERVWHTAIPAFVAAIGLAACLLASSVWLQIILLSAASLGLYGVKGPFWALATERMAAADAAPGIAVITSLAGLAGFVGPTAVGWIRQASGSYWLGLLFLAALCAVSGVITLLQGRGRETV